MTEYCASIGDFDRALRVIEECSIKADDDKYPTQYYFKVNFERAVMLSKRDINEAELLLNKLVTDNRIEGISYALRANIIHTRGTFLAGLKKYDEAVICMKEALSYLELEVTPDDFIFRSILHGLGTVYPLLGKYKESEFVLKRALDTYSSSSEMDFQFFELFHSLAVCYYKSGDKRLFETLSYELKVLHIVYGEDIDRSIEVCKDLISLYEKLDRPDDATKVRTLLKEIENRNK